MIDEKIVRALLQGDNGEILPEKTFRLLLEKVIGLSGELGLRPDVLAYLVKEYFESKAVSEYYAPGVINIPHYDERIQKFLAEFGERIANPDLPMPEVRVRGSAILFIWPGEFEFALHVRSLTRADLTLTD